MGRRIDARSHHWGAGDLLPASAFVFGSPEGDYQDSFKTAWESLLFRANGHEITRAKKGSRRSGT